MPKKLTKILGELLRVATYAIETGIGISKETYQHSDESPVYALDTEVRLQPRDGPNWYRNCLTSMISMDMGANMQTHGTCIVQS
jgi:hypothetical protein